MNNRIRYVIVALLATLVLNTATLQAQYPVKKTIQDARRKVVKVYGAGGLGGLEAYQSGFLVSPEGHIATAWSYVLDVDPVVILDDGRRFEAEVVGFEPQLELAVLKIEAGDLPYFAIREVPLTQAGQPVLAISNLFNIATGREPASVMQGYVAGVAELDARSGVFKSAYQGEVLILDLVANNPGAAGGALVTRAGELVGMLGKELRDARSGAWLNYALPATTLRPRLLAIVSGEAIVEPPKTELLARDKSHNFQTLGLLMVPNVLDQTPAYVDAVVPKSPAAAAGLRPDDLILLVGKVRIENQDRLLEQLRSIDRRDPVSVVLQRGSEILSLRLVR
ncbi:S1C family serine protease [Rosistilla oblonga]|uniref:S1C family serine protease n=1 Tax=Rosistilla oblonga TaxID=2527990 RepID=UPI003A96BFAA